jgi:peptidoglycan/LPS O-acetylase OafA/YrhL
MRFTVLDGIRGFAAIGVMLFHYGHFTGLPLFRGAWAAVDLFFALSGFTDKTSNG